MCLIFLINLHRQCKQILYIYVVSNDIYDQFQKKKMIYMIIKFKWWVSKLVFTQATDQNILNCHVN